MTEQDPIRFAAFTAALQSRQLQFNRGIEREGLRVDSSGNLSHQPHPKAFGSKLSHPTITTDFSESQLELITPVATDIDTTFDLMTRTHRFVTRNMDQEILWSASMPCVLQDDKTIPLADYGSSNLGKLKSTYRNGLGNRYGRSMQTICAVHYNFSFPDTFWQNIADIEGITNDQSFRNRRYFDLMRNFRRFSWLPIYLFGASPAVCNSFVKGRKHGLEPFDEGSLYLPYATSLRSGNLGYQSDAQANAMSVCYNDLSTYVSSLANAVTTPFKDYVALGVKQGDEYLQLSDNILQSEAEFYSTIRAKRVPAPGQNFLECLQQDGVEYIEVRLLDLDPFEPLGVSRTTVRFLDAFLLYCLLTPSPAHDDERCAEVNINLTTAVHEGRKEGVALKDGGTERKLGDWANQILGEMAPLATHLDKELNTNEHVASLELQQTKVMDSETTPSARILQTMKDENIPFFRFAMNQSLSHQQQHLTGDLSIDELNEFAALAEQSVGKQAQIEAADSINFDGYLAQVLAAYQLLRDG
ncbi:MAG: glutamate--cysteine ligase [Candidatus Azotimanducaceae bacterium]|jgi:glutamate--cysteine ligase